MAEPYRTLGLTMPVEEALDATKWIARYAPGLAGIDPDAVPPPPPLDETDEACARLREATMGYSDVLKAVPLETIRFHLLTALSELEGKLGAPMGVVVYRSLNLDDGQVEGVTFDKLLSRRPYLRGDARSFHRLDTPGSLLSVQRIRGYIYGTKVLELSTEQNNLDGIVSEWRKTGSLHIMPQNITQAFVGAGSILFDDFFGDYRDIGPAMRTQVLPNFWAIDCTCGPTTSYGPDGHLELSLANWVGVHAAQPILAIAGLTQTSGASSSSVSFDGYSRSVSLSGKHPYAALSDVYADMEKAIDWERLRRNRRGPRVLRVGG